MAQRQLVIPGPVVKKSNALARAAWSVKSVYEPRLVALVASRVRIEDQDFQDYSGPLPSNFLLRYIRKIIRMNRLKTLYIRSLRIDLRKR